jgi:hypothetical protein
MESLDTTSLKAAGKNQNHVDEYSMLIESYRDSEISTHVGYIIGFPNETAESVRRNLTCLMQEVRPDHASFFMLMPLPGSMDHVHMVQRGEWMDPDFNVYDSHHAVTAHPNLKDGAWKDLYLEAWNTFYSFDNMKAVLRRAPRSKYWNIFARFMWYKNSVLTEGRHPMMCGFLRLKGRKSRRPGYPILSRWDYYVSRAREIRAHLAGMARILLEMEELWLQTRHPSEAEQRVVEELCKIRVAYGRLNLADLQLAYLRAKAHYPTLRVPSKLTLFRAKWSPVLASNKVYTRGDLDGFWRGVKERWADRRWFRIPVHQVALNLFRDAQLSLLFFFSLTRAR